MKKVKTFKHFVLTIFNVQEGIPGLRPNPNDQSWLKHRFKLFDKFCYPSVRGQSNQNFKWIVLFNINTPDVFKDRIKIYSEWENFIPVYTRNLVDTTNPKVRFPGVIHRKTISRYLTDETEFLITSRVDADDALCRDYIQIIQNYFDEQKLQFLNFTNGYVWNYNSCEIYSFKHPSNQFISLIEKVDDFKTVWVGEGHPMLHKVGPVREIMTRPAWIEGVHGLNITNRNRGILQPPKKIKYLADDFEIRKNLFLAYWTATVFFSVRLILRLTWKIRDYMGLTGSQLKRFWVKLRW